ncbi:hypothetical protein TNCV_565071 [Trichonephila clavipes]|nr:hypothetical protein TNCV_565071 [Trichonephila clavipes]
MQGCNQDYSIGKIEFMRTEKGFLYNQEHGDADIEHVLPPEAWLNIVLRIYLWFEMDAINLEDLMSDTESDSDSQDCDGFPESMLELYQARWTN